MLIYIYILILYHPSNNVYLLDLGVQQASERDSDESRHMMYGVVLLQLR